MMTNNNNASNSGMPNAERDHSAADSVNSMYTRFRNDGWILGSNNKTAAFSASNSASDSATAATSSGAATTSRDSSPDLQGELGFERDQTVNFLQHGVQSCEQGLQAFAYVLELLKQLPPGVNITPEFIARAQQAAVYRQQLLIANTENQRLQQDELVLASALESQAEVVKTRNAQITALEVQNADLIKKLDATDRRSQGRLQQFRVERDTNTRLNDAIKKVEIERDDANGNVEFFKQELKTAQEKFEEKVRAEQDLNSLLKQENRKLSRKLDQIDRIEKKAKKYQHFFLDTIDIERSARKHAKRRAAGIGRSPLSST